MKSNVILTTLAVTIFLSTHANAQFTTVQLPTVQNFSMSTVVYVPDRGSVYLGGVNRSASGSSRRGTPLLPNTNRSFGRETSASGVRVSAYIHDFEEMDRQVREAATVSSTSVRQPSIDHRLTRVSNIRQKVQAKKASQLASSHARIKDGVRLENQGKYAAAKAKYHAAYTHAKPEWQVKIKQRLRKLNAALDRQQSVAIR